jgi:hypothetical protein
MMKAHTCRHCRCLSWNSKLANEDGNMWSTYALEVSKGVSSGTNQVPTLPL